MTIQYFSQPDFAADTLYFKPAPWVVSPWGDDAVAVTNLGHGEFSLDVSVAGTVFVQDGAAPALGDLSLMDVDAPNTMGLTSDQAAQLDTLMARTAGGVRVTLPGPVDDSGDEPVLLLKQGETRTIAAGYPLDIPVTDTHLSSNILTDGTIPILHIAPAIGAGSSLEIIGSVHAFDVANSIATFRFELTATQTASLRSGASINNWDLDLQLAGDAANIYSPVMAAPCAVTAHIA